MSYNGYRNRETWNMVLWLESDENSYYEAQRAARQGEDALRDMIEDASPCIGQSTWYNDVITGVIYKIAWHEVASALIGDDDDDEEAED